jgi:transcriptional regulator with XRE-family HTH domain
VGQRIRQHRQERNLTQTELARQIGIQQSDLSRMEKGEYRVSLDVLFRLLQVFEMSLGEFFGDLAQQGLTSREAGLLESFRTLPREDQHDVLEFVEFKRSKHREHEP